jgi:hypothetical protein
MRVVALERSLPTFRDGWHVEAFVEAQAIATLLEVNCADEQFAERVRPTLLRHARQLVAALQGDVPPVSGNVLRFARK